MIVRLFSRKQPIKFFVTIEYAGALICPRARIASSPETFSVWSRGPGAAQKLAVAEWCEKYESTSDLITAISVRALE